MRALTAQETKVFDLPDGYQVRCRVQIKDSGATFRDYSTLEGYDWISSADWDEDVDQPVGAATVRLFRNMEALSLAPLMGGKLAGYVDVAREIKIETACIPIGTVPLSGDWLLAFHGYIDEVEFSEHEMSLSCRDLGSKLQLAFIETERTYSNATGTAVQTVMQSILDDTLGASVVTLYTPVSPSWNIKGFIQKKESLLDALTALAYQIGWDVRYKYDSGTSAYRLTLFQPNRTATVPDYTLKASRYLGVSQLSVSRSDVRNAVQVVYGDRATLDAAGLPTRTTTLATDATSITKYGRQFMEITEGASSGIDTSTEANKMRDAALADLKDPKAIQEVEMHLFPNIELGDLLRFTANNIHYSSDQDLAVTRVSHSVQGDQQRTVVAVRGKPSGPRDAWFQMETKPGLAPTVRIAGPQAPTSVAAVPVYGGAAITFVPPVVGNWDAFELHQSTTNGFTPVFTAGSSTFKAVTDASRFEVSDLTPGAIYYFKVVPVDALGNRGTASAQVSTTAGYVTPMSLQPQVSFDSLVPNPDFEANNTANAPPDTWAISGATWGNPNIELITGGSYSGGKSIRFTKGSTGVLRSGWFVAREGDSLSVDYYFKVSTITALTQAALVAVQFADDSFTVLNEDDTLAPIPAGTGWTRYTYSIKAPASTKYARIQITNALWSSGSGQTIDYDSILVERTQITQEAWIAPTLTGTPNVWANWGAGNLAAGYMKDSQGFVHLRGTIKNGTIGSACFVLPVGYRPSAATNYATVSNGAFGLVAVNPNGDVIPSVNVNTYYNLDGITFDTR